MVNFSVLQLSVGSASDFDDDEEEDGSISPRLSQLSYTMSDIKSDSLLAPALNTSTLDLSLDSSSINDLPAQPVTTLPNRVDSSELTPPPKPVRDDLLQKQPDITEGKVTMTRNTSKQEADLLLMDDGISLSSISDSEDEESDAEQPDGCTSKTHVEVTLQTLVQASIITDTATYRPGQSCCFVLEFITTE